MNTLLVIVSSVLAIAWLPLAARFNRGWKNRKNPVSLAICIALIMFAYTNALFVLALSDQITWRFLSLATHVFSIFAVTNFYVCFYWSDKKFQDSRRAYSVPPTNTTNTPRL